MSLEASGQIFLRFFSVFLKKNFPEARPTSAGEGRTRDRTLTFLTFLHFWETLSPACFYLHAGAGKPTWHVVLPTWLLKISIIGTVPPGNGPADTKKGRFQAAPALSQYKDNTFSAEKQIVLKSQSGIRPRAGPRPTKKVRTHNHCASAPAIIHNFMKKICNQFPLTV